MTMNTKAEPDVDEIIATLQRTGLPTILVEGADDMIVYRRLEERLGYLGASVLPAGGRLKVLEIFRRRMEIPAKVKLAFVVDQDIWVNTGIPADYQHPHLIFTSGYSIENDVFVDGNLIDLLSSQESSRFRVELSEFVKWYSLALRRHLSDPTKPIALHPDHVLDPARRAALIAMPVGEQYPETLRVQIQADFQRLLRGKSLMALLVRNTNYKGRQPRHSEKALLEMVAVRPGALLNRVSNSVATVISV